jgi:V8-like Glu-specific endopeptidase
MAYYGMSEQIGHESSFYNARTLLEPVASNESTISYKTIYHNAVIHTLDPSLTRFVAQTMQRDPATDISYQRTSYPPTDKLHASPTTLRDVLRSGHRMQVNDMNQMPWQFVGFLEIKHSKREFGVCTGTLLTRYIVMTAAHCLYDEKGGYHKDVTFIPQRQGSKMPMGRFKAKETVFLNDLQQEGFSTSLDLAFLILEKPAIPSYTPHNGFTLPLGMVDERHFANDAEDPMVIIAAGYPNVQEADRGHLVLSATRRYRNVPKFQGLEKNTNEFEHKAVGEEGTSGGPVFVYDPIYQEFALIGIISGQRIFTNLRTGEQDAWGVAVKMSPFSRQQIAAAVQRFDPEFASTR